MRYKWLWIVALLPLFACSRKEEGEQAAEEGSFLEQVTPRDSILIADHVRYGFVIKDVEDGTGLALPDIRDTLMHGVEILSPWQVDTLGTRGKDKKSYDLRCSFTITSFDEGRYQLPPLSLLRTTPGGATDTLWFDSCLMDVRTMPVDTASFQIHDIKDQIRYPVTVKETLPWALLAFGILALIAALVWLLLHLRRKKEEAIAKEPAHIRALRKLDKFRGEKFWEPSAQKAFYSGVTDTLREYIAARYDFGAMEMTTAEIFPLLKKEMLPEDLYEGLKELFERADFVKFAKHTATREENAEVLPLSVRFVSETYQHEIEEEVH